MRKKYVAGNWKMNLSPAEASQLFDEINAIKVENVHVLAFPPAVYLLDLSRKSTQVGVGIQNFYPEEKGAFTGEISISQAIACGASYALVGHSERRALFNETHGFLKQKVNACLLHGITPVFCCGEPIEIRQKNEHISFVKNQVEESIFHLSEAEIEKCVIAYEPVWAIGTGLTATSEQAEEMHLEIRSWFAAKYSSEVAEKISILYGGSCNATNAKELFSCPNVDGGLIGGASLNKESFEAIIHSF